MGQTSMVCLMPQSQVCVSFEYAHFDMFTFDRSTCVRNRLSAFQVVQGFSAPAGRCSSALMLRCTLASRSASRPLHSCMRAAFAMGAVHLRTLFRDFRRGTTPRCPLRGCLSSVVCRVRSVRLATALLVSDGAIPASMGRLLVFVVVRCSPSVSVFGCRHDHEFCLIWSLERGSSAVECRTRNQVSPSSNLSW